jgi:hypothetical protein
MDQPQVSFGGPIGSTPKATLTRRDLCARPKGSEATSNLFGRFATEHRRLAKQPLEARVTARRYVECGDEGIPALAVEPEYAPIGEAQGSLRCEYLGTAHSLCHNASRIARGRNARQVMTFT